MVRSISASRDIYRVCFPSPFNSMELTQMRKIFLKHLKDISLVVNIFYDLYKLNEREKIYFIIILDQIYPFVLFINVHARNIQFALNTSLRNIY